MQISPGTQLVWSLSGSEAVNLGMPKIEPDHLFCALLKFVELSDDTISRLLADSSEIAPVCRERDDLAREFKNLPRSTTEIRHALRKETEHGTHKLEGNLIHRSDASRKIFEKAIALANKADTPVYPIHLLQVLMVAPTPAMKKVLNLEDDLPGWLQQLAEIGEEKEKAPSPPRSYPSWLQPVAELAPRKGFSPPEASQPQLKVLQAALTSAHPSPLLLICEPEVDPIALLGKCEADLAGGLTLLKADPARIYSNLDEDKRTERIGREISRFIDEWQEHKDIWLFFDLTEEKSPVDAVLADLIALLPGAPRLITAVNEKTYHASIKTDETAEAGFRSVWLHRLSNKPRLSRI